jgi:hypothetical protein
MMEHDFVYSLFNDVIPINNIIINIAKAVILFAKISELILTLTFSIISEYSRQFYDYAFGANHTYAMIVFTAACLTGLIIYDKILFIESSNGIYKSFQKKWMK